MIMHPDGRIEGTPQEVLEYQRLNAPESCKKEDLINNIKKEAHKAKTPVPGVIKDDFLKGQPWIPLPNDSLGGYHSCPCRKPSIKFEC